jgi:isocitrate dehydrogenase (NAD+)
MVVVEALGVPVEFSDIPAGQAAFEEFGTPVPESSLDEIRNAKVCLKGPLSNEIGGGYDSPNHDLRRRLHLFASVRPNKAYRGVNSRFPGADITVLMHNYEGPDSGIDRLLGTDGEVVEHISVATRTATKRMMRFAFRFAQARGKKLALVHFADQMKHSEGLWLAVAKELAGGFVDVDFSSYLADTLAQQLILHPERFDVIVGHHLWGDVFSGLCSGMVGGALCPVANHGDEGVAVFETAHGTAPRLAGKNAANPSAAILAAKYLLEHVGFAEEASRVEFALSQTLAEGRVLTADLGGTATTEAFAARVAAFLG